jgi:hypothetical protein
MPSESQLILDEVAFMSDVNPMDLPSGPLESLLIGMNGQTSTTASVKAVTGMASISLLRIFLNGLKTEISGLDLVAYNLLAQSNVPLTVNSGTSANNPWSIMGLCLPLNIPSNVKAQIQVVYVAQTNNQLGKICIFGTKRANLPGPFVGLQRKPITPTVTASYGNRLNISMAGAKITGLLLWSTTIPTTTAVTTSLHKLRLIVKGAILNEYNWFCMGPNQNAQPGDSDLNGLIDNYRFIPFAEPIDASDVIADIYADDTNACVVIPVYQFG